MWPFRNTTDSAVAKCEEILQECRMTLNKIRSAPEPRGATEVALAAEARLDALLNFFGLELATLGTELYEIKITDQVKFDVAQFAVSGKIKLTTAEVEVKHILSTSAKRIAQIQERTS